MKTKMILFYAILVLLGGCIPVMSVNPFYTKPDLSFDEKLLGTWVNDSNNEPDSTWIFERAEDSNSAYKLTFIDKKGGKGLFTANLMKLDGKLFLDVFPKGSPSDSEDPNKVEYIFNTLLMIPAHTIMKVDSVQPQLIMYVTAEDKIDDLLKEHPDAIGYKEIEGRTVLTSSTKDLQVFILKYTDNENLFPNKIELKRKTVQASKQ
jgi:hypothetical protein